MRDNPFDDITLREEQEAEVETRRWLQEGDPCARVLHCLVDARARHEALSVAEITNECCMTTAETQLAIDALMHSRLPLIALTRQPTVHGDFQDYYQALRVE